MNELEKILEGLVRRTADGKLKWSPSATSNEFVTSIMQSRSLYRS